MSDRIVYAVGDIHGRFDLLLRAAEVIERDLDGRFGHVVFLGDYVDRGPQSREVVDWLMAANGTGSVTCLRGNHEQMMIDAQRLGYTSLWLANGGQATRRSYGPDGVPEEHIAWMEGLPTVASLAGRVFVHAGFMPGVEIEEQEDDVVMWIRGRFLESDSFGAWPHIVHGHTPQHPGKRDPAEPELLDWRTNLDTAAFYTGVLTVGVFEGDGGPCTRTLRITTEN